MLQGCSRSCSSWAATSTSRIPGSTRSYAISVRPPREMPGKKLPRVFADKKAFQYNWYSRILNDSKTSPVIFLHHKDFSAQRLVKLRGDILAASKKNTRSLASPIPTMSLTPPPEPSLTIIRSTIFGAALRNLPDVNLEEADQMLAQFSGGFAILSLPSLDPPQLSGILRALDRGVPPRKPKTAEEIKKELAEKNADPETPGRRVKRMRTAKTPELKLVGALIDGRVFLPDGVRDVSKLPTLETLRAQIVGLLSAPATQLAGVLSEASGGKLARTLEGLRKGLEEEAAPSGEAAEPSAP